MEDTQKETFKSDSVSLTVKHLPDCIIEYNVQCKPSIVKAGKKEAIHAIAKEVSLPGFRKGKAPDTLIEKNYPSHVAERWEKEIANLSFIECQKITKIPLLDKESSIHFKMERYSLEEGGIMNFAFETEPTVPKIDLTSIELQEVKREVIDDAKVEESIHQIQTFFAEWNPVSSRLVEEGDFIVIDIDIIEQTPPERALQNARFEVKKEKMAKWMHEMVLEMKPGESKEGISTPDTKEEEEKLPPKKVRLILKSIEIPTYPPLDNSLAKKVGTKNVDEMRDNLRKLLNKKADDFIKHSYREQINAYLLKTYPLELPKSLVQKETSFRFKQLMMNSHFQKKFPTMGEEERKAFVATTTEQAKNAIALFYFARAIIQEHGIAISPTEIHKEISNPLEALFSEGQDRYSSTESSKEQESIALSRLLLAKAEDFMISKAKVITSQEKAPEKAGKKKGK
ncbi:MAG: trigger factor [Simkania negevensis]|nr:trigger factor [Simkania negevensis]